MMTADETVAALIRLVFWWNFKYSSWTYWTTVHSLNRTGHTRMWTQSSSTVSLCHFPRLHESELHSLERHIWHNNNHRHRNTFHSAACSSRQQIVCEVYFNFNLFFCHREQTVSWQHSSLTLRSELWPSVPPHQWRPVWVLERLWRWATVKVCLCSREETNSELKELQSTQIVLWGRSYRNTDASCWAIRRRSTPTCSLDRCYVVTLLMLWICHLFSRFRLQDCLIHFRKKIQFECKSYVKVL